MAYATKYRFSLESDAGTSFRIDIQKDGYSGTVLQRPLGRAPHLRRDSADNGICGTSLEIWAECANDGEFSEFYTTDAQEYKVLVQMYVSGAWTTIWTGFISPELYAEPEIAPPYDVQITAVDGLGELKYYAFPANGRQTLLAHLQTILAHTGLGTLATDILSISSLRATTPTIAAATMLANTKVNLDFLSEGNCYDALQAIMQSLHMIITRHNDKWLLVRESDVEVSNLALTAKNASGTSVSLAAAQYGSMQSFAWWPVGQMNTEIVPAKKKISAGYPYRCVESLFTNPETANPYCGVTPEPIGVDDCPGWSSIGVVKSYQSGSAFYGNHARIGKIQQTVSVEAQGSYSSPDQMTLRLSLAGIGTLSGASSAKIKVKVFYTNGPWLRKKKHASSDTDVEWATSDSYLELTVPVGYYVGPPDPSYTEFEIPIPYLPGGDLTIQLDGSDAGTGITFLVGGVYLTKPTINGYQDVINIDNSARESERDLEISFGDAPYTTNALASILNVLSDSSGNLTSAWATANFAGEYLSVIAMDYALCAALPRLRARGILNVPKDSTLPVAFLNPDGVTMLIDTYSWDLLNDELDVQMTSVPAASVEITSEAITQLTDSQAQEYASGYGGSQSAGAVHYGGTSQAFFEAVEANGETVGAKALYDLHIVQTEEDEQQGTPEVTKNISEILRHLSLQVLNAGTASEETIIVADITFASQKGIVAGGIAGGGGGTSGGSLETLADVTLSNKANGDILRYNALTSHWENGPLSLALADLSNVSSTAPTDGQALVWDNANSVWKPGTVGGSVTVTNKAATIGTSLTTIATVGGTDITAKITHQTVTLASGTNDGTLKLTTAAGTTDNIAVKGITATKISHWEDAYSNMGRADKDTNGNNLATQTWVTNKGYLTSIPVATADALGGIKIGYSESNSGSASNRNYAVKLSSNKAYVNVPWVEYSLPLAASGTRGGIQIGYSESNSGSSSNRNYAVKLSSEKAYVNVPWVEYSHPTGGANTTITAANGKVLSAITVNNLGHVTSVSSKTLAAADIPDLSGSYLPISGGTLTGDLRLKDGNYGQTLYFGNGSYCYLSEDTDDHLKIYARYGIDILTSSTSYGVNVGSSSAATPMTVFGHLTVGSDASTSACKTLTLYGRTSSSYPALSIYGVVNADTSYRTDIYRDSTALKITSSVAVTGNITASGAITAGSASDRRLKKDIKSIDINTAAEVLAHLHPVRFAWNDIARELGELSGQSCGFLADEYLTVIPSAGRKIWGDYDAIDYNQSIPYLVAGWQQQNMRIRILEGEISALRQEICQMRRKANVV